MALEGRLDVTVRGADVEFALTVQNAGTEPVALEFRSGLIADFAVYEDGAEVWRWSDGRLFTQAIEAETLAPGESFTDARTWEDAEPGEYAVEATLETTGASVEASAEFVA